MNFYNANEAAKYIGFCRNTVLTLLHSGSLPGIKSGNRWLISEKALDRWVEEETYKQTRQRLNKR